MNQAKFMEIQEELKRFKIYNIQESAKYVKEELYRDYDYIISIGPNCFIRRLLDLLGVQQETHFFDYIGSSMKSICDLLENDFTGLFEKSDYKNIKVLTDLYIYSNVKYGLHFKHDFPQKGNGGEIIIHTPYFIQFIQKYKRRILRLQKILESGKRILFIRGELNPNRISYLKDKEDDMIHLRKCAKIIRNKYVNSNCTFLWISVQNKEDIYDEENQIYFLKASKYIEKYEMCHIELFIELYSKMHFIKKNIER